MDVQIKPWAIQSRKTKLLSQPLISTNMTTNEKGIRWALHIEVKDETVDMINHERSVADELFECVWSFCGVGT